MAREISKMSFDDLVKLQCDRHETLKRVLQNFRKDAQSRKTSIYFQKRLQQIESISKEFAETHKIIICAEGYSESSYYTNNVTSEFEERYMDVYCAIAEAFEQTHPKTTGVSTTPIDASALAAKGQVQMPQIPVPSFSGQCIDWPGFYDAFTRLIHDNAQLNEIQKFHFLKESLPESRDNDIRQMQLTAANYNVAWTTLVTRYNNPRTVFSHHMNALYNISTMHREKGDEIRLMLSTVNVCIAAFKRVNVPVQQCDHWLAHYLATKLPKDTYNAWEHHRGCKTEVPSFADFEQFLNDRLVTIDAIENRNLFSNKVTSIHPGTSKRLNVHNVHAQPGPPSARCCHCGGSHILRRCPAFLAMDCHQRKEVVTKARLCLNCLSKAHTLMRCTSTKGCQQCGQRHHTLLHYPSQPQTRPIQNATLQNTSSLAIEPALNLNSNCVRQQTKHDNSNLQCLSATYSNASQRSILLATARVIIFNPDNGLQATLNALIDQGSEATIVSEHVVQSLHLKRHSTRTSIAGVGQGNTNRCKHIVNFVLLTSANPEFRIDVETAYVLNSLTSFLPSHNISVTRWKHIEGLSLADPQYYRPKRVDLIIGVDLMAQIILPGIKVGAPNEPIAQNTQLGWILSGRTQPPREATHIVCHQAVLDTESLLKQFCEVESVPERRLNTAEDVWCETFFQQTHKRQPTGRYMVRLPLKTIFDPSMTLGKSHQIALNRYLQLERRLTKTPEAWQRYSDGIKEYFSLNQLAPATTSEKQSITVSDSQHHCSSCVLPHHAVYKEESLATKLRIVFDASANTSNGRSLNDILCVGPTLQNDMSAVILNWRQYRYAFTADIQRMYRCIDVHPEDSEYQRILWRAADGLISEYRLTTVTFGTASAPYTAIRIMHQIAEDERLRYPAAENVFKHEMYVDDILSGDHTFERAEQKRLHVTEALKSACMELRKWSSNHALLLTTIPLEHQCKLTPLNWGTGDAVKTLGMYWLPNQDFLKYKIPSFVHTGSTKRIILSNIARLFDPLGLIAPIIISAKIILKQVTMAKHLNENGSLALLDWDDPVPESTAQRWQEFCNTMLDIDDIVIPRWLRFNPRTNSLQLHAFCDGSSDAYAAAVYIRVEQPDGMSHTALITAKSKISPTKPLTIPRTELCGAVLAIKLMKWVVANQRWTAETISSFYWTDATIVLHWISGDVNRWKTFVSNRVAYILEHSTPSQWSHVSTRENPADCATRGLLPAELAKFKLWWHGPNWLAHSLTEWPSRKIGDCDIDAVMTEAKPCKITVNLTSSYDSLINRFSSYTKLLRVTAYLLRFCKNARGKSQRLTGFLSTEEIQRGMHCIVRIVQLETFAAEIKEIHASKSVPHKSKLSNLSPIMQDDILRIRGRLRHSKLPFNRRCPIILPNGHFFTELVIKHSHHTTLHGGAQLTLAHTRYQFWIINGRQAVRRIIQKCVRCFRTQPTTSAQIMGDLPLHRVNPPGRPFEATGVDYTGAIELKAARLRGTSFYKGYIAIFICLATKAIHLEAVTGLTAEHFMWALDRFTGRRGLCRHLYSDNGTNFVGADNALKVAYSRLMSDVETVIAPKLATQSIQWHFNPPHSPNFGGLWEANVKSVKHHLKRVAVNTRLTYEELSTVLVRIESCLNSRPLCPLTADPDDLDSLTPAHFLIGDSMLAPAECRTQTASFREQFLTQQKMVHQFWKQWSHDWLANLQKRPKWCKETDNLKVDDLVIVKDDRVPPTHWILGRVVELHPGADALVRVVTLKTKQGKLKRSISKLCRLPISA